MADLNKIYNALREKGVVTKSYEEFANAMADGNKRKNVYNALAQQGLITKSYKQFSDAVAPSHAPQTTQSTSTAPRNNDWVKQGLSVLKGVPSMPTPNISSYRPTPLKPSEQNFDEIIANGSVYKDDNTYNSVVSGLDERIKQAQQQYQALLKQHSQNVKKGRKEASFWERLGAMPDVDDVPTKTSDDVLTPESDQLRAARETLHRLQNTRVQLERGRESKTQGDELAKRRKDGSSLLERAAYKTAISLENFGKGFMDALRGSDMWATNDAANDLTAVKNIVDKVDRWNTLTDKEKSAMTSADMLKIKPTDEELDILNNYALAYNVNAQAQDPLSSNWSYTAGGVSANSALFGIEMAASGGMNVSSSTGRAIEKGALKLSQKAVKNGLEKLVGKTFEKSLARKIAGGVGQLPVQFGMGALESTVLQNGITERKAQEYEIGTPLMSMDENGVLKYSGSLGKLDAKSAHNRALVEQTIENQTEMLGGQIGEVLGGLSKVGVKVLNKTKFGENMTKLMTDVSSTQFNRIMNKALNTAGYNGFLGEYLEEHAGDIEQALFLGTMTFDTDPETGIYNKEHILETMSGLAPMMGGHLVMEGTSYGVSRARMAMMSSMAERKGRKLFGDERWAQVKQSLGGLDNQQFADKLSSMLQDKALSDKQKKAVYNYAFYEKARQGFELMSLKQDMEGAVSLIDKNSRTNFVIGYEKGGQAVGELLTNLQKAQRNLRVRLGDYGYRQLFEENGDDFNKAYNSGILDTDQKKQAYLDYVNASSSYQGALQRLHNDKKFELVAAKTDVDNITDEQGNIVSATTTDGKKVNIINGNVVLNEDGSVNVEKSGSLVVVDSDGKRKMISASEVASIDGYTRASDVLSHKNQEIVDKYAAEEIEQKIQTGAQLPILTAKGVETATIVSRNEDGSVSFKVGDSEDVITTDAYSLYVMNFSAEINSGLREDDESASNQNQSSQTESQTTNNAETDSIGAAEPTEATVDDVEDGTPSEYAQGDEFEVVVDGQKMHAEIVSPEDADGRFVVNVDDGESMRTLYVTPEELAAMEYREEPSPKVEETRLATEDSSEKALERGAQLAEEHAPTALERIPRDEKGNAQFSSVDTETAWDGLVEMSGNEETAHKVAEASLANAEKKLKAAKALKEKGDTPEALLQSIKENEKAEAEAEKEVAAWKAIVGEKSRREEAAKAEAERIATEKAEAERKAAEERERAEKEEKARIEAEKKEAEKIAAEKAKEEARVEAERKAEEERKTKEEERKAKTDGDGQNGFNFFTGTIKELIAATRKKGSSLIKKVLSAASNRLIADLKDKGVDISPEYNHTIDNNAINHALNRHSSDKEKEQGQIPLTEKDIENVNDVIDNYDEIKTEKNSRGQDIIIYKKRYTDGTTLYVEEVRTGRKELAMASMRKQRSRKLTDADDQKSTPSSDLPSASADKGSKKAEKKQKKQSVFDKAKEVADKEEKTEKNPSGNKLVTDERYEELKKRMKAKLGQLNAGVDPEMLAIGTEMAVYHIEKGARKFVDYAKEMIADLGDAIRPYLKAFYNGARDLPEVEEAGLSEEMTPYDEVRSFDTANFDKENNETKENNREQSKSKPNADSVSADNPQSWVGRTFTTNTGAEFECKDVDGKYATFFNKNTFMNVGFEVATVQDYLKRGVLDMEETASERKNESVTEKAAEIDNEEELEEQHSGYSITPAQYTTKRGVVLDMHLVKFDKPLSERGYKKARMMAESSRGWYDRKDGGFMMRTAEDAEELADKIADFEGLSKEAASKESIFDKAAEIAAKEEQKRQEAETKGTEEIDRSGKVEDKSYIAEEQNSGNVSESDGNAVTSQQTEDNSVKEETTQKEEDNGLQRVYAVRTEGLPSDSSGHERRLEKERGETGERAGQKSGGTDGGRGGQGTGKDGAVSARLHGLTEPKNTRNNHSERGADHAPTSVNGRIEANIKAIELAHELLESGETATPEQMGVLRQFSGWGGLGAAFSDGGYDWKQRERNKKIRELLGEEAYEQAVMSANSAYYTPAYVVDTLWDIARQLGFKGGNILEGSAGIGNILGQMPTTVSERSDIHAIEIDGTSGGILSLLYPDAKVDIQGFEQTRIPNGSVDLAITNVPFVTGLRVNDTTGDSDLSKKFHNIHDFCIAKNVRKLRDGGLGIFISSNGTLDGSKALRDWVVNEGGSDFIGAFRMNNKTFGGTTVTSDIIVIRKRVNGQKSPQAIDVSTISGERTAEYQEPGARKTKQVSMDYNKYFMEHPDHMAGEMRFAFEEGDTFRPTSKGLYPVSGKDQGKMLADFVKSFTEETGGSEAATESAKPSYVSDASVDGKKLGEMYLKDGKLVTAGFGGYYPLEVNDKKIKGHTKQECFNAYAAIKTALADVMKYQTENEDNAGLKPLIAKLNKAYDDFVNTYGHFNKNNQLAWLRNDVDYPNVFSLETYKEQGDGKGGVVKIYGKADVMKDRVVEKESEPHPENVKDGVVVSMFKNGRIDVPYIAEQLGKSEEAVKREIIDSGLGFEDPATRQMEVSYQYLSGNVREKLRQAEANNENGEYTGNIKALQEVVPMDIPAHLIDFTLGSSWLDPKLYDEYVKDRTDIDVHFTSAGGTWFMKAPTYGTNVEKNRAMGIVSEMLKKTIMGHELIAAAIQNKSVIVSRTEKHYDGTTETITDREATAACAAKIDEIRQDFKDWVRQKMQGDADLSARMEQEYNDRFNNYVHMSIPDDFVPEYFGGATHKFKMRPHQGKAIVRGTMQPLLLAHEVGTGKTFTLISTAMEMRRLGTARKPMIVVQNATVGQFAASAKELYPNAKILTLEDNDRNAEGRKNFYAKIKYNDWDMIVVPQSTFEFIPDSEERQMQFVQDQIDEKMLVLEKMSEADSSGRDPITRRAEKELADLQAEMAALSDGILKKRTANNEKKKAVAKQNAAVKAQEMLDRRTDDVENFDDMGIDALLIDEAHEYKHLGFATAMQRGVKGVDPSYSKKSQGVYLKTQAVLEKNNGRNVIFATGTPISNTAAEIWTFMRYLMPKDTMKEYGIYYFDDFVRNFGNIQQMPEFNTSGKFKEVNRFAGYINLPELVRIWSGVADTVLTKDQTELVKKIPEMEGGKAQDIYLPQTRGLRSVMKYVRKQLDDFDKMSGKEKKENSSIPLTMYGIAQGAAVDVRLVLAGAADEPNSKTNEAVRQTLRSLKETDGYKGTVAIFADHYQNKRSGFNLYEDIKKKLIAQGVPADEVVVMKPAMTIKKKLDIFDKVNRGEVRVVLGSTATLGTGVNIQERLHTLIHLDAPNRPMDYTQRNGRILRQGNLHKQWGKPVRVLRFGVEDSLDVTAYQRLKTKGAIADSVMEGDRLMQDSMNNRVLEEEEDVFGDTVAQLSGSEYALLKNNAEKNVRKYESRRKQWQADQMYIHNAQPKLEGLIKTSGRTADEQRGYLEKLRGKKQGGGITVGKHEYASVDDMADYIKTHNKAVTETANDMKSGKLIGAQTRELTMKAGGFTFNIKTVLSKETGYNSGGLFSEVHRKMTYSCGELGLEDVPVKQSLLRNAVTDITETVLTGQDVVERIEAAEQSAERNRAELELMRKREGKPFEFEKELETAKTQLAEYTEAMKKEMAEKESKYAKMDAEVEEASGVSVDEEDVELYRDGNGELSVDDVSRENDIVSKVTGRSRYTEEQKREYAGRQRVRIEAKARETAEKLHLDNVEFVTDTSGLSGRQKKAKGFFNPKTGKITIVLSNHANEADVERTILHEAVAHYGLRQLFGERFDTFLDNVYENAENSIRGRIDEIMKEKGVSRRTATEEYLAELAERTDFTDEEAGWWYKIKRAFLRMVNSLGFNFGGVELTDNELRYILWRSYENLAEPGRYRTIFEEAKDMAKQQELKVGNYAEREAKNDSAAEDGLLFRDGGTEYDFPGEDDAQKLYNAAVDGRKSRAIESWQDEMFPVKMLQEAIEKATGEKIADFENAYLLENQLGSAGNATLEKYAREVQNPMRKVYLDMLKAKFDGGSKVTKSDINKYVIAFHGLERNKYMADKNKGLPDARRDYSGFTALFGNGEQVEVEELERRAEEYIGKFEDAVGKDKADKLWSLVDESRQRTLDELVRSGLVSGDVADEWLRRFEHYVPLQGFSEEVIGEDRNANFENHITGRMSEARDPLATLVNMEYVAVTSGNHNRVKQAFYNLALNHRTNLLSVMPMFSVKNPITGEWEDAVPQIDETMSPIERQQEVDKFIKQMRVRMREEKDLPESDKTVKDARKVSVGRKVLPKAMPDFIVRMKVNGRQYAVVLNGNPRAAQAINGRLKEHPNKALQKISGVTRFMSAAVTSWNPAFMLSNFARDVQAANAFAYSNEGAKYAAMMDVEIHKNLSLASLGRDLSGMKDQGIYKLYYKYRHNQLDMSNERERFFKEFIDNGGETGYTQMVDIDKIAKQMQKDEFSAIKTIKSVGKFIELANKGFENATRFAAYATSRKMGKSVMQSINDAKEISVNFNRHGNGRNGYIIAKSLYQFLNPTIQGLEKQLRTIKEHPLKGTAVLIATPIAIGFAIPLVNIGLAMLSGGGDDDKKYYWSLSDWTRRNNLIIGVNGKFIKIPLPPELRVFYGIGEMLASKMSNPYDKTNLLTEIPKHISETLPFNDTNSTFPSFVKPFIESEITDKDFMGRKITGRSDYNTQDPEWKRAGYNTDDEYIAAAKWWHSLFADNDNERGSWFAEINPSVAEHLIKGYTGGMGSIVGQVYTTVKAIAKGNEKDYSDSRNWPIVNRVYVQTTKEDAVKKTTNTAYRFYQDNYKNYGHTFKETLKDEKSGIFQKAQRISNMVETSEYKRYRMTEPFIKADKLLWDEIKALKETDDKESLEWIEKEQTRLRSVLVDASEKFDNYDNAGLTDKLDRMSKPGAYKSDLKIDVKSAPNKDMRKFAKEYNVKVGKYKQQTYKDEQEIKKHIRVNK